MPKISITVSKEEKDLLCKYAEVDSRSLSNFIKHATRCYIRRNRKKDASGVIIDFDEKMQSGGLASSRKG